jgi:hypothetical protein
MDNHMIKGGLEVFTAATGAVKALVWSRKFHEEQRG